jgi:hypothetical protein
MGIFSLSTFSFGGVGYSKGVYLVHRKHKQVNWWKGTGNALRGNSWHLSGQILRVHRDLTGAIDLTDDLMEGPSVKHFVSLCCESGYDVSM